MGRRTGTDLEVMMWGFEVRRIPMVGPGILEIYLFSFDFPNCFSSRFLTQRVTMEPPPLPRTLVLDYYDSCE